MIAEHLHKTLGEIDAMPHNEYVQWMAYLTWKAAMLELARS